MLLIKDQEIKKTKTHEGMLQRQGMGNRTGSETVGDNQLSSSGHMNKQWKLPTEYWEGAAVEGSSSAGQKNKLQQTSSKWVLQEKAQ